MGKGFLIDFSLADGLLFHKRSLERTLCLRCMYIRYRQGRIHDSQKRTGDNI